MTITITEKFLSITMEHDGYTGWKGYDYTDGATHEVNASIYILSREVESKSIPSYSQTVAPISYTMGKKPEKIKIEGPLCLVTNVSTYISQFAAHRNLNTIYNVFLPCSIVTVECTYNSAISGFWIVESFKIKRDVKNREWIFFELVVDKWYATPGVNG